MKKLKRILPVLIAVVMLFAITGCAKEQDKYVGTWKATWDLADFINETVEGGLVGDEKELAPYIMLDSYSFDVIYTFNADGTYTMKLDETSILAASESLVEQMTVGMTKYLEDTLANEGVNMSVDDFLAEQGTTVAEMVSQGIDPEALKDEMIANVDSEGNYKVEEGKLWLSAGLEYEVDEAIYFTTEVSDTEIKLVDTTDDSEGGNIGLPMVLTKQAS